VIDGKTGIIFPNQTQESLVEAIQKSLNTEWCSEDIAQHA